MKCENGHEMHSLGQIKLEHEETDTPRDTETLRALEEAGFELGGEGTLWYCVPCDYAQIEFEYPGES